MSQIAENLLSSSAAPPRALVRRAWPVALLIVWLASVVAGLYLLWLYEATPGAAEHLTNWPADTNLVPASDRPTLVMFVHPRCSCARASLTELARLLTQTKVKVDARVYFYRPSGSDDDWWQTELYTMALAIPRVRVGLDDDNLEATRFGAHTSGHTVLFDPDGRRLFAGGITAARGHVGDNAGRATLLAWLHGEDPGVKHSLVFGCPLTLTGSSN